MISYDTRERAARSAETWIRANESQYLLYCIAGWLRQQYRKDTQYFPSHPNRRLLGVQHFREEVGSSWVAMYIQSRSRQRVLGARGDPILLDALVRNYVHHLLLRGLALSLVGSESRHFGIKQSNAKATHGAAQQRTSGRRKVKGNLYRPTMFALLCEQGSLPSPFLAELAS